MIKAKLSNIGKDIYTVISELVQDTDIINLAKVSPNIPCSDTLLDLASCYIKDQQNILIPTD